MQCVVLPPPDAAEVERVAVRIAQGLRRLLERRGLGPHDDPELADPLATENPALSTLYSASVRGKIAEGPRRGQQVLRFGDRVSVDAVPGMAKVTPRCAKVAGLSVHANVAIPAGDRARIERLCRYAARPPLAAERVERLACFGLTFSNVHAVTEGPGFSRRSIRRRPRSRSSSVGNCRRGLRRLPRPIRVRRQTSPRSSTELIPSRI